MPAHRTALCIGSLTAWVLIGLTSVVLSAPGQSASPPAAQIQVRPSDAAAKLHPALLGRLDEKPGPAKAWVFFADKGIQSPERG